MPLTLHQGKFFISKKLYAYDPQSFKVVETTSAGKPYWDASMKSIWYKRKDGITIVCYGTLRGGFAQDHAPTLDQFINEFDGARYGGSHIASWDGAYFVATERMPRVEEDEIIEFLEPLIRNQFTYPEGWSGWYQLTERRRG